MIDAMAPLQDLVGWIRRGSMSGVLTDCSLVVPTYRRPREVVALLERLRTLPDQPKEVVVVDGSGEDETSNALTAWASEHASGFDVLWVDSPRGLTRQRNVGIDASTGDIVFFLDDDCLPHSGYFAALRQLLVDDADERVGGVGGTLINEMGMPVPRRWQLRFLLRLVPRGEPGTYYPCATSVPRNLMAPFTGSRRVDVLSGGASAWRRSVFSHHRFSLFFSGYAQGEDMEMSLRVRSRWTLLWCGDAHADHYHAPGGRPPSRDKARMEVRNRFFIWKRHTPHPRVRDRVRFWGDVGLITALDVAHAIGRPKQRGSLRHALGCWEGAVSCVFSPPRYEEPPAQREYRVALRDLAPPATQGSPVIGNGNHTGVASGAREAVE